MFRQERLEIYLEKYETKFHRFIQPRSRISISTVHNVVTFPLFKCDLFEDFRKFFRLFPSERKQIYCFISIDPNYENNSSNKKLNYISCRYQLNVNSPLGTSRMIDSCIMPSYIETYMGINNMICHALVFDLYLMNLLFIRFARILVVCHKLKSGVG